MKDRKANSPGQYMGYVPADMLEAIQNGETFDIILERNDDPVEEGTPYNKASVLPDDVAEAICPGIDDPTPADAFRQLSGDLFRVKEILEGLDAPDSGNLATKEYVDNNLIALLGEQRNCEEFWSEGQSIDAQTGEIIHGIMNLVFSNGYVPKAVKRIHAQDPFEFSVFGYRDDGSYLGSWNGSSFVKGTKTWFSELELPETSTHIKIEAQHIDGPQFVEMQSSDFSVIQFFTPIGIDVEGLIFSVAELRAYLGNVDAALDSIIAIQNELIGGDGV